METTRMPNHGERKAIVARNGDWVVVRKSIGEIAVVGGDSMRIARDAPSPEFQQATDVYLALRTLPQLGKSVALTYRCKRRCPLLHVIPTPNGVLLGVPPHVTNGSEPFLVDSDAYESDTTDGRHWKPYVVHLPDRMLEGVPAYVRLNCRHVANQKLDFDTIRADLAARRASVIVIAS